AEMIARVGQGLCAPARRLLVALEQSHEFEAPGHATKSQERSLGPVPAEPAPGVACRLPRRRFERDLGPEFWLGLEPEGELGQDAEGAARSHVHAVELVAGHVLHHAPARAPELRARAGYLDADQP